MGKRYARGNALVIHDDDNYEARILKINYEKMNSYENASADDENFDIPL